MKKITCNDCHESWYLDDEKVSKQTFCAFCGSELHQRRVVEDFSTFGGALYGSLKKLGPEILETPGRIASFMLDVNPGLKKEAKIFARSFSKEYGKLALKAFTDNTIATEGLLSSISTLLIEEEGLSSEWANLIGGSLTEAYNCWHSDGEIVDNFKVKNYEPEVTVIEKKVSIPAEPKYDSFQVNEHGFANNVVDGDYEYQKALREWEFSKPVSRAERHIEEVQKAKEVRNQGFKREALKMFLKIADQGYADVYMDISDLYSSLGDSSAARKWKNKAQKDMSSRVKKRTGGNYAV